MTLLTKKKKKKASWKKGNHVNYKEKLGKNTVESLAPFEINDITTLYLTNT